MLAGGSHCGSEGEVRAHYQDLTYNSILSLESSLPGLLWEGSPDLGGGAGPQGQKLSALRVHFVPGARHGFRHEAHNTARRLRHPHFTRGETETQRAEATRQRGSPEHCKRGPRAQPSASHTFSSRRPALSTQRACASHGGLGHVLAGAVSGVSKGWRTGGSQTRPAG